jgi:methylase of polypeptide subunit release factors
MKNEESSRQRLLEINRQQAEFYEQDLYVQRDRQSLPVRIWGAVRDSLHRFRQETGIGSAADELHQLWLGDLAGSKVLDLGVGCGNALSIGIARRCREYHAIDLSERLAASFQQALLAASSLSDLMGRSEKSGRRAQFFTDFKRIVVLFVQKYGEK